MYTTDRARQTQQILLRKHKLPGTNFPTDHDRRHISTSGIPRKTAPVRYGLSQWEIASIAAAKWYVRSAISLQKHKLPRTNFTADHDRRHISTSGTPKNAASSLRLESMGNRVARCCLVVRAIRDFTAETQTAGDKLSSPPRPTPYFHFRYREKRR